MFGIFKNRKPKPKPLPAPYDNYLKAYSPFSRETDCVEILYKPDKNPSLKIGEIKIDGSHFVASPSNSTTTLYIGDDLHEAAGAIVEHHKASSQRHAEEEHHEATLEEQLSAWMDQ